MASAALSWHLYKMAQGRVELPKLADDHLVLGVQGMWQDETQVNYFGLGSRFDRGRQKPVPVPDARRRRLRDLSADEFGGAQRRSSDGWDARTLAPPAGSFKGDFPDTRDAFATDPAVSLDPQPSFLQSEAAVTADTRDHRGYPTSGFVYRAALTHYMDRSTGVFSFREYEAEGLQFVPIVSREMDARPARLDGRRRRSRRSRDSVLPAARAGRQQHAAQLLEPPVSRQQSPGRERRIAPRVSRRTSTMAVFADAGNVASRFADLNLDKTSMRRRAASPHHDDDNRADRMWRTATRAGASCSARPSRSAWLGSGATSPTCRSCRSEAMMRATRSPATIGLSHDLDSFTATSRRVRCSRSWSSARPRRRRSVPRSPAGPTR